MLKKWCNEIWLYVLYAVGAIMFVVLLINWNQWEVSQRLVCIMTIILPAHAFEEWRFPAGFHYQYNLTFGSKNPNAYPMSQFTDMITICIAEILFIALIPLSSNNGIMIGLFAFCSLEVIAHTVFGFLMLRRFKNRGKKTIYGPGTFTAYIGFGITAIAILSYLLTVPITSHDWVVAIIFLGMMLLGIIVLPEQLFKRENSKYAFPSAGYFEKFLD